MRLKKVEAGVYQQGFTLIELMVVMVIIGLLTSLVGPAIFGKVDSSRIQTARAQLQLLGTALDTYRLDVGIYPVDLDELLSSTEVGWDGPYVKQKLPLDPWGSEYAYERLNNREYTIYSFGADRKPGGTGDDADIYQQ